MLRSVRIAQTPARPGLADAIAKLAGDAEMSDMVFDSMVVVAQQGVRVA